MMTPHDDNVAVLVGAIVVAAGVVVLALSIGGLLGFWGPAR